MKSAYSKIIFILASVSILSACAPDFSDEITPEIRARIDQTRQARQEQLEEQNRQLIEPPTVPTDLPPPVEVPPEEPQAKVDQKPEDQGLNIPLPRPRPATPESKIAPSSKAGQLTGDTKIQPAPESGSCKYVSGLSKAHGVNKVTLTFDDGPSAKTTPQVLDILKKYRIKATFFTLGQNATKNTSILKRIRDEGHILANHSWDHPNFHSLSNSTQRSQIDKTEAVLEDIIGHVSYFRYPYGNSTCDSNAYLHRKNYSIIGWHIDTCDWAYAEKGSISASDAKNCEVLSENRSNLKAHIIQQVKRHKGGILLMHDIHSNTVRNLEPVIQELLADGFEFVNVDDASLASSMR